MWSETRFVSLFDYTELFYQGPSYWPIAGGEEFSLVLQASVSCFKNMSVIGWMSSTPDVPIKHFFSLKYN